MEIEKQDSNTFLVKIDSFTFKVTVDDDYLNYPKEDLIRASFKFLLDREPLTSILQEFNLKLIQSYFPEYEDKIKDYLV